MRVFGRFHEISGDLQLLALPLIVGLILGIAGNPSDAVRLAFLSAAGIWLISHAIRKKNSWLLGVAAIWWLLFLFDAALRSVSWFWFDSDVDAYFILSSVANTNRLEVFEFLQMHSVEILIALLSLITLWVLMFLSFKKMLHQNIMRSQHPFMRFIFGFVGFLTIAAYLIEPSRVLHPVIFWQQYHVKINNFKNEIHQHQHIHQVWDRAAQIHKVNGQILPEQTHVLTITDSLTSQNFGVCGYPRQTTPTIQKHLRQLQVFCQAYSPEPSTIAALKLKLTNLSSSTDSYEHSSSFLADAKANGYKLFWISNQSDHYISSLFGRYADYAVYMNQRAGRSSSSLDETVLPEYLKALADPHPKKLIILHLIGAHPNYANRYPERFDRFNVQDQVQEKMQQQGYGFWIKNQRNQYDNAILYQDWLWGQLFEALKQRSDLGFRSFVFVSDHGNEVGHELNYAGHSAKTRAGYHVPLVVWHDGLRRVGVNQRVVSTAVLDDQMLQLMQISQPHQPPVKAWLAADYRFVASQNWPYWRR